MKTVLELNSEKVSPELGADFVSPFSGCDQNDVPPFMKLFWKSSKNMFNLLANQTWDIILKYCFNLAAKSSSTYNDLRYDSKNWYWYSSSTRFTSTP